MRNRTVAFVLLFFVSALHTCAAHPLESQGSQRQSTGTNVTNSLLNSTGYGNLSLDCGVRTQEYLKSLGLESESDLNESQKATFKAQLRAEPCFGYKATYSGREITHSSIYQTLIYAYAWGRMRWSTTLYSTDLFKPPSCYGLEFISVKLTMFGLNASFISWLLETIAIDMINKNEFRELFATITYNDQPFASLSVRISEPGLGTAAASNDTLGVIGGGRVHPLTNSNRNLNSRNSNNIIDDSNNRPSNLQIRSNSRYSLDNTLNTRIYNQGPLIVSNVEPLLMTTLLRMARSAFDLERAPQYVAHSPHDDIITVATCAAERAVMLGEEVLDPLIDLIEWQYLQKSWSGLFQMADMQIDKVHSVTERVTIASMQITIGT